MADVFETVPTFVHSADASSLRLWTPRGDVVVTRVEGALTNDLTERMIGKIDPIVLKGRSVILHDWTAVTSFDVAAPTRLTAWALSRLGKIERLVIATAHPIVAMAVRAANLTLKRIEHVESRDLLVAQVRKVLG